MTKGEYSVIDQNNVMIAVGKRSYAVAEAKKAVIKYPKDKIFIEWCRASDGQRGYLNSDGNHSLEGSAW